MEARPKLSFRVGLIVIFDPVIGSLATTTNRTIPIRAERDSLRVPVSVWAIVPAPTRNTINTTTSVVVHPRVHLLTIGIALHEQASFSLFS